MTIDDGGRGSGMSFRGEIEQHSSRRGPGWWMDADGEWCPPQDWPEDTPPLPQWILGVDGKWEPPLVEPATIDALVPAVAVSESDEASEKQLRGPSDGSRWQRARFLLGFGVVAVGLGVFVAINQAGADSEPQPDQQAEVIFAGRTAADDAAERSTAAAEAPTLAREWLATLSAIEVPPPDRSFVADQWNAVGQGCLSIDEQVLIERSRREVGYVDANDCVVDSGVWFDRYQQQQSLKATGVVVELLIPPQITFNSGGWAWDDATIQAFASDVRFRPAWTIAGSDTGYNPRGQSVEEWRPPRTSVWCAYAVDWIAVKHRWRLGVNDDERSVLTEMLDNCGSADPDTVQLREVAEPHIGLVASR